jgi:hypothetical protein
MKVKTIWNWKYIILTELITITVAILYSFMVYYSDLKILNNIFIYSLIGALTTLVCMCKWDVFEFKIIEENKG